MSVRGESGLTSGQRLDQLSMTKKHYGILFLLAGGGFFDGFDLYLAGSVLAAMVATHFSSVGHNASFISATFFGLLLGTLISAIVGDRLGRKFTSKYSLLIYGIATILCAVVHSFSWLVGMRFIAGIGLGAVIVTSYGLWVEFVPKRSRGFWTSTMSFLINLSQPAAALLALILIPHYGWRSLFWFAGIPPIIIWLLQLIYLPESPRWLEEKGRKEEANKILSQFEGSASKPAHTIVQQSAPITKTNEKSASLPTKYSLWAPGIRKITILSIIISVLNLVTWYTFTAWIPTFFVQSGLTVAKSFTFSFVIMLGAIPGNALAALISDKLGRKKTLVILSILLGIIGLLYGYASSPAYAMVYGFLFVMGGNILIAIIMASYIPELFPTPIRMAGSSLANAFGRAATILSPYLIAYLFQHGGQGAVFWSSFIMYIIMAICVLWLGRETKEKSLEEITHEEVLEAH